MKLSRTIMAALVLLLVPAAVFSADAVIKSFSGKVEIQQPGSQSWQAVSQGQAISPGTMISTGFSSSAVLDLGSSEIFVKQLTRISVDELETSGNTVKTDLNLRLGRIKADVKTTEGLKHNFTLKTPVSTAAVRGTVFDAGVSSLDVIQGMIAYANKIGQTRSVGGGSSSSIGAGGFSVPVSAIEAALESFDVSTTTSAEEAAALIAETVTIRTTGDGTVAVTLIVPAW